MNARAIFPAVSSADSPPSAALPTRCADEAGASGNQYRGYRIEPNDTDFPQYGAWKFAKSPRHPTQYAHSIRDAKTAIDMLLVRKAWFDVADQHAREVGFDQLNATCRSAGIETMPERGRGRFATAYAKLVTSRPGFPK